ncbi:MAG: cytochrome b/b6 domain-containing protein [Congregibacter sp.]
MSENNYRGAGYPLWDWPVRLIHWGIALLIPASWWTAEEGYLDVHQWLGLSMLVAVLTRVVWGLIGSPQARFTDFLRGPKAVLAYFRGGEPDTPGHNPAGGWSAFSLWVLLVAQALTGTVNSDDVFFTGPFHYVLDSALIDKLAGLHEPIFMLLLALIALHLIVVLYYELRLSKRLLKPMLRGRSEGREGTGPAQPLYKAVLVALILAGVLWMLLEAAPAPPPSYW